MSFYDEVGGAATFEALVAAFYRGVAGDEPLRSLYPEAPELGAAERRLRMFLEQYFGGPTAYSQERGHPRLRMRHMPFHVGPLERDRWLHHMVHAVEAATDDPDIQSTLLRYFVPAAEHLRNDTGLPISPADPRR